MDTQEVNMDKPKGTEFLFSIAKEVKHFYETPVIFFTKKDFSDPIFNAMCTIRTALLENRPNTELMDAIVEFHVQWLHAVKALENFKTVVADIPREEVYQAISYTIDAMNNRQKYFQKYMENNMKGLSNTDRANIHAELEIVEDMHKETTRVLLSHLKCFRNYTGDVEFQTKLLLQLDVLLQWLDKINDGLAIQLSNVFNLHAPELSEDLTKALQKILDEFTSSGSETGLKMLENLKKKGNELSHMLRYTTGHKLEITKVVDKINSLNVRIERLESEHSSALMALKNKKAYLERRLESLENMKTTIKHLQSASIIKLNDGLSEDEICTCEDFFRLRIFNHMLPQAERERLVTELCLLWNMAVFGDNRHKSHKSVISILSAADIKEEYTDDLGTFYVDQYGRNIYRKPSDETLYQANEKNELVPISDDQTHIYFFDDCGRYYIDPKTRQRVYKVHDTASEYMMDSSGVLLKVKEEIDGVTYYYDSYGRYYLNEENKHIYREPDSVSEYESDGLGNLIRIRSLPDLMDPCPDDAYVTEDCKYLRENVGSALRQCIAELIMRQPADPIKYLAGALINYRGNCELRDQKAREQEALNVEREVIRAEEQAAAEQAAMEAALLAQQGGSEASYDSNLLEYKSINIDVDTDASSKP